MCIGLVVLAFLYGLGFSLFPLSFALYLSLFFAGLCLDACRHGVWVSLLAMSWDDG